MRPFARRLALLALPAAVAVSCRGTDEGTSGAPVRQYGLGRAATEAEVAALDIDVGPDGVGLPPGSGTPAAGAIVYIAKCASCHGARGEGQLPVHPRLVGRDSIAEGFPFGNDATLPRSIGNYWPFASTVFDYVRRSMPPAAPGSLTDDEVYALTAYLLAANRILPQDVTLDAKSLAAVKMPYANRFVPDDRTGGPRVNR